MIECYNLHRNFVPVGLFRFIHLLFKFISFYSAITSLYIGPPQSELVELVLLNNNKRIIKKFVANI